MHELIPILLLSCFTGISASGNDDSLQEVVYSAEHGLKGYLAKPKGEGPFPVAIYHHGGYGPNIGGSPRDMAIALAKAGFIGFAPVRRKTVPMPDAIEDARAAMKFIKTLPAADKKQIVLLGFSRGGYITFYSAAGNPDVKAVVIMASAPGRRNQEEFFQQVRHVQAPVLLMVAENDNQRTDLVAFIRKIKQTLDDEKKESRLIVYPPYRTDGHRMFFQVGSYWKDVVTFLQDKVRFSNRKKGGRNQ